ncbi:MAG: sucrose phosphorylase [Bacteroidetes bacterium]|nr:sucrose phosphorylase [Bacteroidota bacterium]MBU1115689.1 sucrose phosphorylase [Bacteroidota bacterium]MBU1798357.1 sucrose phosphorylase [Bacteroidota bacterium]
MSIKNKVQLITYPDSLGGDLKTLNHVLMKYFPNVFQGGIHILPPFPSSGDRGFAPLTYLEIEPQFGTWDDIKQISAKHDILLDLMVNHISAKSEYFKDFIKHGRKSKYADLFITVDKIWADGKPPKEDIEKIFLRRTEPFSDITIEDTGKSEKVWTTFGKVTPSEQIDIDIKSEITKKLITDFMINFNKNNVKIVRLDAIGYVVKKPGTTCFMIEPEIHEFLDWITDLAKSLNIELLPEVHSHYTTQFMLADKGHWVYDFILPYTILETLLNKNSERLQKYLKIRPHKQFTMLDCHDGIPIMPDLNDLVSTKDAQKVVDICLDRGANLSRIFSPNHKYPDGFDIHQIRCSYYSMLNCNDDAYIASRAIQFFAPGIPQVYYVGLLAGKNDEENVNKTGEGREINRHNFSIQEIAQDIKQEVVQRLLKLIKFRNEYPAFNGDFIILDSPSNALKLKWEKDDKICTLIINLDSYKSTIEFVNNNGAKEELKL